MTEAPGVRPFAPPTTRWPPPSTARARGAAHGGDLDALAEAGAELLALPERGYVAHRDGKLIQLAAADDEAAAALLRAALARSRGAEAEITWLTGAQGWAIDVALAAGLELRDRRRRGRPARRDRPFRPYLPSGAYL